VEYSILIIIEVVLIIISIIIQTLSDVNRKAKIQKL